MIDAGERHARQRTVLGRSGGRRRDRRDAFSAPVRRQKGPLARSASARQRQQPRRWPRRRAGPHALPRACRLRARRDRLPPRSLRRRGPHRSPRERATGGNARAPAMRPYRRRSRAERAKRRLRPHPHPRCATPTPCPPAAPRRSSWRRYRASRCCSGRRSCARRRSSGANVRRRGPAAAASAKKRSPKCGRARCLL